MKLAQEILAVKCPLSMFCIDDFTYKLCQNIHGVTEYLNACLNK